MQTRSTTSLSPDEHRIVTRDCPMCRRTLVRERRRTVDRLYSLFQPVRRYRCQNFACQWMGNFAADKTSPGMDRPPSHRVPAAFVVHMALVAVGVVLVIVLSNLEPTTWAADGELQRSTLSDQEAPLAQTRTEAPAR